MARSTGLSQLVASGSGRLAITKKLVLWSVLVVQVGFIGCIWLLQMNRSQLLQQTSNSPDSGSGRVHFVRNARNTKVNKDQRRGLHCMHRENTNRYQQDFYQKKSDKFNRSADYAMPAYVDLELAPALWCYREGTLNETSAQRNDRDYLMAQPQCLCDSGWHGRDCGQPEIIWRALMTHSRASKRAGYEAPLKLHEASGTSVKRLFYMLNLGDWEHINLELLHLQLRTLMEVVDFYLIYYYVRDIKDNLTRRQLERNLNSMLSFNYVLYQCKGPGHVSCTGAAVYAHFRHQLWTLCSVQTQATDLLLYGDRETLFSPAALKFLKYYASDVLPLRFRLKHNVYGFYWQHPKRTRLSGVISSLVHLHAAQMDPQRLERQATYTLGDLNHYGGWSCELCLSPEQIVLMLQTSSVDSRSIPVRLPNQTRSARIDANYVQQLMGTGVHLDGSTQLLRLRQQSEKYFAPDTATLHSSQFGQLLYNMYDVDVLDDVQEDED
ncbi:beta-1,4-mannosyl-glycoprotein 4-beta-N-acetylglucosaminyltransferase [Drosophila innubila]|uniref:beta-1,4-mannosyl-glycoprotein 4-beta-N-acetylglucosaminyltransferase n=1 Tax=Drosophila innubila TaxID=198719 RepID=UPI00148C5895|nr:beta-1,4-mannosyl-glycoprotein 4-beta-N-acetylglucosaminyltransferase [Drosophila innubila]